MKKLLIGLLVLSVFAGCTKTVEVADVQPPTEDDIHAALEKKNPDWQRDEMIVEVADTVGKFSSGVFTDALERGPNFWFAVKEESGWSIITSGNYGPYCDEIDPYEVPYELVKFCIDRDSDEAVQRNNFKLKTS